jgi:hypothetical protein
MPLVQIAHGGHKSRALGAGKGLAKLRHAVNNLQVLSPTSAWARPKMGASVIAGEVSKCIDGVHWRKTALSVCTKHDSLLKALGAAAMLRAHDEIA